jgi:hypothetical protein
MCRYVDMHVRISVGSGQACLPGPGAGRRLARRTSSSYNSLGYSGRRGGRFAGRADDPDGAFFDRGREGVPACPGRARPPARGRARQDGAAGAETVRGSPGRQPIGHAAGTRPFQRPATGHGRSWLADPSELATCRLERVTGIEPPLSVWELHLLAPPCSVTCDVA